MLGNFSVHFLLFFFFLFWQSLNGGEGGACLLMVEIGSNRKENQFWSFSFEKNGVQKKNHRKCVQKLEASISISIYIHIHICIFMLFAFLKFVSTTQNNKTGKHLLSLSLSSDLLRTNLNWAFLGKFSIFFCCCCYFVIYFCLFEKKSWDPHFISLSLSLSSFQNQNTKPTV